MKSIISILALASVLMMSCKKDFLEILPESTVTVDLLFKTDKDFQDAVVGAYKELNDFYNYFWQLGDLPGENCVAYAARSIELIRIDGFSIDVNDAILRNSWRDNYHIVERTNLILSKLESADVSIVINKELYTAEAKFLRALAYFHLVRIFGDIPMVIAPITIKEALETPRTSVDIIYNDLIIKDLLEAESKLPSTWSASFVGRATKGAAKSLLGLVYLTRKDFVNAESKLQEVTAMGYALLDNFEDLFDFDNEHHSEYIFDIEYTDGNVGVGSSFTNMCLVEVQDVGGFSKIFNNAWGIPVNVTGAGAGSPSLEFIAEFDPNDLRKERTVATGTIDITGNWVSIPDGSAIPAITKKYLTTIARSGDGKANWRVFRYADVLLMLAEAMNENGKTDLALPYLNQVRTRAGLEGYAGLTQDEAREMIYLERRFELYMEGHRWFDLVRTGRALSVMAPYGMKDNMTIFPIPQAEIEVVNDPEILWQNPGY